MEKIEKLKADKALLENCVRGLEAEIEQLNLKYEYSKISRKMIDLAKTNKLLENTACELETEQIREKNKPDAVEQEKLTKEFDRKSDSYHVLRRNYIFIGDN